MRNRLGFLFLILFGLELFIPSFRYELPLDLIAILGVEALAIYMLRRRSLSPKIHAARILLFGISLIYLCLLGLELSEMIADWRANPTETWRSLTHALFFVNAVIVGLSTREVLRFFGQIQQHPPRFIVVVYSAAALISTLLLVLPVSLASGVELSYLDALFTSVSALSGAGLVVTNTALSFSYFGEAVLLVVIQAGGIGIITFSGILLLLIGKELGLRERVIQDDLERLWFFGSLKQFVARVSAVVFVIEGIGAVLLYPFMRSLSASTAEAVFHSIFHSVSAFCTAGFTSLPDGMLTADGAPFALVVVGVLSIIGMLGMPTIFGILYLFNPASPIRRLGAYAKMEVWLAVGLLLFGMLSLFIVEAGNPIYSSTWDRLVDSFFQSSQRGAGFNSVVIADMSVAGIFILLSLLFVAGAPMSTAGGMKTATIGTILIFVVSFLRGVEPSFNRRRLPPALLTKAVTIVVAYFGILFLGFMALYLTQSGTALQLLFEAASALSVCGLSLTVAGDFDSFGKSVLVVLMMIGRIGMLTGIYALLQARRPQRYRNPVGDFYVG